MKIFCIGANKTGTTSLTKAMNILGYKTFPEKIGNNGLLVKEIYNNNITDVIDDVKENHGEYNFFEDIPFCLLDNYKLLVNVFEDSKFILTVRDSEEWFDSVIRWIRKHNYHHLYKFIYNEEVSRKNKNNIIEKYENRNQEIIQYFGNKNISNKLLVINIPKGDGWKKLCSFLNKVPPLNEEFPWENANF